MMTRKRRGEMRLGEYGRGSRDWFLSKQCDVMRIFLLQIFVGQGVEAWEHIFAACFILFYVIPQLFEIVSCLRRSKRGQHDWRGFLFDSYAGFRVAYRFLFVDWTRGSLLMAEYKSPLFLHAICVSTMFCIGRRPWGLN